MKWRRWNRRLALASVSCVVVDVLIARQAGVVSRSQALRGGIDAAVVDRLVRTRRWRPLHPRVYLAGDGPGAEARAWAAVLWAGEGRAEGAVLSGAAAAWWHGLPAGPPPTTTVTVPEPARGARQVRPGVAVRCRPLAARDRTVRRGLPVTALARTALDAAVELGGIDAERLLGAAVARVGRAEVLAAHRRAPTLAACAVLAEVGLVALLRGSGMRGWRRCPRGPGAAAVVFPAARVAVEVAGRSAERGAAPGWRVLRFDRPAVEERPAAVLATIAAAVGSRDLRHLRAGSGPRTGHRR